MSGSGEMKLENTRVCVIMTLKRGVLHGADCSLHTQCVCHYDTGKIDVDCETGPVWRLSPVAGGSSLLTYHHPGQARVLTCGQNRERELKCDTGETGGR